MKICNLKNSMIVAGCLTLLSCSSGPKVQEFPVTASAVGEIENLSYALSDAKAAQVDVLSPDNYRHADEALMKAEKRQAKAKSPKETLHLVAVGNAYLNQAGDFAKISRENMREVANARQNAIDAGAMLSQKNSMESVDEDLLDVTESIENNDLRKATRERTKLQAQYRDIELQAIKHQALTSANSIIEQTNAEEGAKYAPRSKAIAEKRVIDTDAFITSNRYATTQIALQRDETQRAAEHYRKMTRSVKAGKRVTGEDAALALESEQDRTAMAKSQLRTSDAVLAETRKTLAVSNEKLLSKDADAQATARSIEKDRALQARYEKAQEMFSEEEAEVYKQGDKLLIRLRGLKFPSAKAVLKGKDFELLAKVEKVLKDFGENSVEVQGYTDSDGSKSGNQRLSTARAKAVRQYFVASAGVDEGSIKAIGFGDRNPLAPNNTKLGKAQNRRVDIVITPAETVL